MSAIVLSTFIVSLSFASDRVQLNTNKKHIKVDLWDGLPRMAFYDGPKLIGKPIVELNAVGLYISDKLVCWWPDKNFDMGPNKSLDGMVLGYSHKSPDAPGFKFSPCPMNQPVRSLVSDAGLGLESIYIEYETIDGDLLEARLASKPIYLSLKALHAKYKIKKPGTLSNHSD